MERKMFEEMLVLLAKPDRYVCVWRDGEIYIELADHPARAGEVRRNDSAARVTAAGVEGSLPSPALRPSQGITLEGCTRP
jgi:hypothetical protein